MTPEIGARTGGGKTTTFYQSNKQVSSTGFALNQHAYFHVPETASYTFALGDGDADAYLWVGNNAYSGWTSTNNVTGSYYDSHGFHNGTYTTQLTAGDYVPIRVYQANEANGGPGGFDFDATFANGTMIPDEDFVQYNCRYRSENNAGQPYPAFGNES